MIYGEVMPTGPCLRLVGFKPCRLIEKTEKPLRVEHSAFLRLSQKAVNLLPSNPLDCRSHSSIRPLSRHAFEGAGGGHGEVEIRL